jgi:tetratricopeptide (TPR) repeat protein
LKIKSLREIKLKLALLCKNEGESYIHQQQYDKAIDSFKQSVENDPLLDASWELLGGLYAQTGKHDLAVNAFEQAIKLNPTSIVTDKLFSSLLILGQRCLEARNLKRSEDTFKRATKVKPQSVAAWSYLGDVSFKQSKFIEAEKAYRNAISLDPNLASPWVGLGNVLAQQNKFQEAEEAYQKAISLDPSLASTHIGLGNVLVQQGKFIEAEKAYRNAISLDPNLASSWVGLGNVLAQQNKFQDAEEAYQKAIFLDPGLAPTYVGLGNVLAQQQKYHDAFDAFNKAIERDANLVRKLDDIKASLNLRMQLEDLFSPILIEGTNNVALLLDTSSSMQGQKISDAKEVIIKAVKSIPTKCNAINLIFFGASIQTHSIEPGELLKSRDRLINSISQIGADGNTPLMGALNRAWKFLEGRENRIMVIVTDGMPNDALPKAILDYAKSLKNAGCRIISLGIGKGTEINEDFLKKIASRKEDFHLVEVDLDFKSASYMYVSVYQNELPK